MCAESQVTDAFSCAVIAEMCEAVIAGAVVFRAFMAVFVCRAGRNECDPRWNAVSEASDVEQDLSEKLPKRENSGQKGARFIAFE